jgi:hypothetical protein
MAFDESAAFLISPIKLGSTNMGLMWGDGVPDGDSPPFSDAVKGTWYAQLDAVDDTSPFWVKVDLNSTDDDWVQALINKDGTAYTILGDWTWGTDKKLLFRDAGIYIFSPSDGVMRLVADTAIRFGDGTNQACFAPDGELTLEGTAKVKDIVPLPIMTGGGTANVEAWNDGPTINFDADTETFYAEFIVPKGWDATGDMTYVALVGNEIAEDDGDDVSFTLQVAAYADGETVSAAGQTVAILQDLTGGDEAINKVNKCSGVIDYNHATYPLSPGDVVQIKGTVNLGAGAECTGPLHICSHGIEFTRDRLGETT